MLSALSAVLAVVCLLIAWILYRHALDHSELEARLLHVETRMDRLEGGRLTPARRVVPDRPTLVQQ